MADDIININLDEFIGPTGITEEEGNKIREEVSQSDARREATAKQRYDSGWVNFGNNKLNINTTTAKGLEKALGVIARFLIKVQGKINQIYYGKLEKPSPNLIKRLLNRGLVNLLTDLASVNFCDIFNYSLNQVPDAKSFNPNENPDELTGLERKKWKLQKTAYDVQKFIDRYYIDYADSSNSESKVGLFLLIQSINESLSSTILSPTEGLNDPAIKENFPQVSSATNFLQNSLGFLNKYTDPRQISSEDFQKILNFIDGTRRYSILIQGLNNPKNAIAFIDSSLNTNIQQSLTELSRLVINPNKAVQLLKAVMKTANNINNIGQKILGYISTLQFITRLCITIVRVFNVLKAFMIAIIIPSLTGTKGADIKLNDVYQSTLKELGEKKLIKRLQQISFIINLMAIVVSSLLAGIRNIIARLKLIYLNLQACVNVDDGLKEELRNTINNLSATAGKLQQFLDNYNDKKEDGTTQFGKYLIQIVTEQVVDEGINLRRRYGIARDTNGYIVAQSTPTFASLDLIIINEVKALLVSKGLVTTGNEGLSVEDQVTILDVAKILGDDSISLDNIQLSTIDITGLQDQNDELGLNEFINNLPGGKALRRKIRKKMLQNYQKLGTDLKSTDPQSRFSSGIIKQQQSERNKLEIQVLEDKIDGWKKEIALAATQGPIGLVVVRDRIKKIKDAEKRIQELRQG
jgi:hypothetical protein